MLVRLALCVLIFVYFLTSIVSKVISDELSNNIRSDYEPDVDELSRGVSLKPMASWGNQLRNEHSVRVLCIGGSVTASNAGRWWDKQQGKAVDVLKTRFVNFLDAFLKENVSANSYALNEGRSGRGPDDFYGGSLNFETLIQHHDQWPNVIVFDFTVNIMEGQDWKSAEKYDILMRLLKKKWALHGLEEPEFVLLEFFSVEYIYRKIRFPGWENQKDRIDRMNNISLSREWFSSGTVGFDRGTSQSVHISTFARFYCIPLLSWTDVGFPAMSRHFTQVDSLDFSIDNLWSPKMWDGTHLTLRGQQLVGEQLLGTFFLEQVKSRDVIVPKRSNTSHCYDFDLHMFAPERRDVELYRYSSWGLKPGQENTLAYLVIPNATSSFVFMRPPHRLHSQDNDHTCYGSHVQYDMAKFTVPSPPENDCEIEPGCSLRISTLHSWNQTYIGNLDCSLYEGSIIDFDLSTLQPLVTRTILGSSNLNGETMTQYTIPLTSPLWKNLTTNKTYSIVCAKLDARFTCIDTISVAGQEELR